MEHDNLRCRAASGARWSGASIAYTTLAQFVTTAVLARLLSPSDFGLLGMMTVVMGLIGSLADAGVSNAIISYQDTTKEELSTLYWLNLLMGIGVFLLICLCRPLAVGILKEPRLSSYLPWIGINFLILPLGQQFQVLLRRDLRFRVLTMIDMTAVTISSAAAVAVALRGFGIWSLICRSVLQTTIASLALWAVGMHYKWLPGLCFSLRSVRRYVGFGLFQMGERLAYYFYANVDYWIIGRLLGAEKLGFYSLGYSLITLPLAKINPIITGVAFPAFAKIQADDQRLKNGYLRILRYISICSFPMMAGMFMVAPLFVQVVYGAKWLPAVPVVQILCIIGTFYSLGNPLGSLLLAKRRADLGFYYNVGEFAVMFTANIIGVNWGIVGVAWSLVACSLVVFPFDFYIRWHLVRMKVGEFFDSISIPATASASMVIVLWAISFTLDGMSDMAGLIVQIAVGATFYFLWNWIFARPFCLELKDLIYTRERQEISAKL